MYSNGFSIQDMPVSSAIMAPVDKQTIIHDGRVFLKGWAYSGGGNWPVRVEVSGDGGSIWYQVPFERMSKKYFHAWRLWSMELPVDAEGWLEFCVRCWDNSLNTQALKLTHVVAHVRPLSLNWDLHVTSSCHRIKIYSVNRSRPATRERLELLEKNGIPFESITKPIPLDLEDDEHYEKVMRMTGDRDPEE